MDAGLKQKTMSGMIWSFIQKFGVMSITFISNLVLARLLTPDDYGCIGMLMIFILIANTFIDGGFGSALIQKKKPTQEDYSTIFYWNLILSISLYVLLYFTSPAIASFYKLPLLSSVLKVQGLVLILNSLSIVQQNKLRKQLLFKKLAIVNITSAIFSLSITIYLAYLGWGVWALVAQQILLSFFNAILYWIVGNWKPSFVFSRQSFKELFNFGGFILLSNLINTLGNNIQGLLIGKFFNSYTMGLYSQARKLEEVASTSLSSIIDQVSFPIFSEIQNDKYKLVEAIKKIITTIAYLSFPIIFLLIAAAKPLFIILYSEIWVDSVPYFQLLCIAGLAISLQNINYYAVAAIGKSKTLFKWTIIKRLISLLLVIVGFIIYGIWGLMIGMVCASYTMYVINAMLVSHNVGYSLRSQIMDLSPILLISLISFLPSIVISLIDVHTIVSLMLIVAIFLITYIGLTYVFMKEKFIIIHNALKSFKIWKNE